MSFGAAEIITRADTHVGQLLHVGDPALIAASVQRFIAWRQAAGLPPGRSATYNIWYDDPTQCDPARFRLGLCAATEAPIAPNPQGVTAFVIPGGRCARLRCAGAEPAVLAAVRHLTGVWLPQSGEALRDFPSFWQRVVLGADAGDDSAVTDLYLPLL